MKSKSSFVAAALALALLPGSVAQSATAQSAPISITPDHLFSRSPPYVFDTMLSNVRLINSPVATNPNSVGAVEFNAKAADLGAGSIQIRFYKVNADMHFVCNVGETGRAFTIRVGEVGDRQRFNSMAVTSGVGVGGATLDFSTGTMFGTGDLTVVITADDTARSWLLYRCDITPLS